MSHGNTRTNQQYINEAAGGGTVSLPPVPNPFTGKGEPSARLVDVKFFPDADLAANGTNNMSLVVRDLGDTEDLSAAISNASDALSKGTAAEGGPTKNTSEVAKGKSVFVKKTENGTGALAKGTLVFTWEAQRHSV